MNLIPDFIRRRIVHRPNLVKIFDNMGWLFIDKVLRLGVGLLVGVWVARYLGPGEFGLLSYASAFVGIFSAVAGLGLQNIVVRDMVRDPSSKEETLGSAAFLLAVGGLLTYGLILGTIFWLRQDDLLSKSLVAVVGLTVLFKASEVGVYWFESQVLSKYTVWVQSGSFLIFALVKIGLIVSNATLIYFAWVTVLEALVVALLMVVMLSKRGLSLMKLHITLMRTRSLIKDSWPLLLSGVAITLAMRVDQIMIGQIINDTAVGFYSIAVRLAEVFVFVGLVVSSSVFPRLIELSGENFEREFERYIRYPFYALLVIAILVSGSSNLMVPLIFGSEYSSSAPALSVLIFSIPITYVSVMSTNYLLKNGMNREILFRQIVGLGVNISLNLMLIPSAGIVGAAVATVLADVAIAFGLDFRRNNLKPLFHIKSRALFGIKK